MSDTLTIRGIQEAQNEMIKVIARLTAYGPRRKAIQYATTTMHRYLVAITHVDTGAYRASQWMAVRDTVGTLYVNPATINPRSGKAPAEYSFYEEKRGGTHAAYQRTIDEAGPRVIRETVDALGRELIYAR